MANANSLDGLTKFLSRDHWAEAFNEIWDLHVGAACAKADVSFEELPDLIGDHHSNVLWGCVFEDLLARERDDGRNIIDDYLKRRGWKESVANKTYMTALRSSVMSLYEISDIVPEQSFLARDLVRGGEPVRVNERMATRSLKPWDRLAARIVRLGSRTELAGGAMPFHHDTGEILLKTLRRASKVAREQIGTLKSKPGGVEVPLALSDTEILRSSAFMFTNIWLDDLLQRILNPQLPDMRNTDGDKIVLTTVSFPLKPAASIEQVRRALATSSELQPTGESSWDWIEVEDTPKTRLEEPPGVRLLTTRCGDGATVLGTLALRDRSLVFEMNSQERAARGRALVEAAIGEFVDEPLTEAKTVAELMASRATGKSKPALSSLSPDEEQAILSATMDRHYATILDDPIPMLGNKTPRQAAKNARGREKLVAWLKYIENQTAKSDPRSAVGRYDMTWMWEELGILELRR